MKDDVDKIFEVFEHIKRNDLNSLDELTISVLLKSYLVYLKVSDNTYQLSSNGKLLQRMLKYNLEFQKQLQETCKCQDLSNKEYKDCLASAVHFAATFLRCNI